MGFRLLGIKLKKILKKALECVSKSKLTSRIKFSSIPSKDIVVRKAKIDSKYFARRRYSLVTIYITDYQLIPSFADYRLNCMDIVCPCLGKKVKKRHKKYWKWLAEENLRQGSIFITFP